MTYNELVLAMREALRKANKARILWDQGFKETRETHPELSELLAEIRWSESQQAQALYSTGMRELNNVQSFGIAALVERSVIDSWKAYDPTPLQEMAE